MQVFSSFLGKNEFGRVVMEPNQKDVTKNDPDQITGDVPLYAQYPYDQYQGDFRNERNVDEHLIQDHHHDDVEVDQDLDPELDLDLEAEGTMTTGTTAITGDPARFSPGRDHGVRQGGLITPRGSFSEVAGVVQLGGKDGNGLSGVMRIRIEDEDGEETDEGVILHDREYSRSRIITSQPMRRETPVMMTTTTTTPLAETFGIYNSSSVHSKDTIMGTQRPDSPARAKDDLDPLAIHRDSLSVLNGHNGPSSIKRSFSQNDPSYHPLVDIDTPLTPFPVHRAISRTSTPPLTTKNLELISSLPDSVPTYGPGSISTPSVGARRRWGLERTASWASQISASPKSTVSSDDHHRAQGLEAGRAGGGIKRPGFIRSRTAHAGISGSVGKTSSGLARATLGTGPGMVLQRSRSHTVGPGSERFPACQSGSSGSHLHHPYRLVLTDTTGGSMGSSSAVSTTSTSVVAAQNKRVRRELDSLLFEPDEYFRGLNATNATRAADESGSSIARKTSNASSRLLRPKLWRGISGKSNLGSAQSNALMSPALFGEENDPLLLPTSRPVSRGPTLGISSRSTVATKVDEYMMDMDKWVLGTGEVASACAGSPIRSFTPIPELEKMKDSRRGGLEDSSTSTAIAHAEAEAETLATLDGKDGKMWVDGCEVVCDDGTACLATHEAYSLNVQLLHRTYSTSIYLSKEHKLHIAGEKTMLEEYSRVIEYPKTADMNKVRATLVDGLVSVHVPRLAQPPPVPSLNSCSFQQGRF